MIYVLYAGVILMAIIFGSIFIGFIIATIVDLYNYRKYRVFNELQRDHNERRRPALK